VGLWGVVEGFLEPCLVPPPSDMDVNLQEAAVAVVGEPLAARFGGEPNHGGVVEAEVDVGVHHAGHRGERARAALGATVGAAPPGELERGSGQGWRVPRPIRPRRRRGVRIADVRRPLLVTAAALAVASVLAGCKSSSDAASDLPRPSKAFCQAAARYDKRVQVGAKLSEHIELVTAIAMTEPGAGSDLQGIKTTAIKNPTTGEYVINGSKTFITNGQHLDFAVVLARTNLDVPASKGTCLINVEAGGEGGEGHVQGRPHSLLRGIGLWGDGNGWTDGC